METAGAKLAAPDGLVALFADFFQWEPQPPRSARELADTTARLCRLLREEVTEQLGRGSPSLTNLATDWRKLLFPSATDETFADGYAQAVTFGLLMARARDIVLSRGLDQVARELRHTNTLIGTALRLLTDDADNETALKTSLATLTRVLDAVHWFAVGKGNPEAWLYFYEDFLSVYDNDLRKKTGSYYTPPEVVRVMVRLVDEALRSGPAVRPAGGARLAGGDRRRSGDRDRYLPARDSPPDRAHDGRRSAALGGITLDDDGWTEWPLRPPRLVLPPICRSVGRVRGPGRPVRLRRLRRHARADLGDRARPRLAGATMGDAAIRSRCPEEGGAVPSASAGRQAHPQAATAGTPWS